MKLWLEVNEWAATVKLAAKIALDGRVDRARDCSSLIGRLVT